MRQSSLQKSLHEADDSELITLAAKGNREAFGRLYERYVFQVYRHVYCLADSAPVAEDLTGQTFLKALESIEHYEMRGVRFLAWLLRIAHNLTVNHKKGEWNRARILEGMEVQEMGFSPELSFETKVNAERLKDGVRQLKQTQRQVIVMRFIDGLSTSEIAQVLNKKAGAVRVIQCRALLALRKILEDGDLGLKEAS